MHHHRAYAGITVDQFQALNPFTLCGVMPLQPGAPVCIGNTMAFCNNVYVADNTDTCDTIASDVGTIVNIDGARTLLYLHLLIRRIADGAHLMLHVSAAWRHMRLH